jgi:hypothetical protein
MGAGGGKGRRKTYMCSPGIRRERLIVRLLEDERTMWKHILRKRGSKTWTGFS